jgi:Na+-transporting methylmalonyl-CoA/oxaloacetate decarboxylase gamma subunit
MENLGQGLVLSLTGLLITFAALGGLILLIAALEWVFRPRRGSAPGAGTAPAVPAPAPPADDLDDVAAAIAAALSQLLAEDRPPGDLGAALRDGPGPWWRPGGAGHPTGK